MLEFKKNVIVEKMIGSLIDAARYHNVDLKSLNYNSCGEMLNSIDDLFKDGGEVRCEQFSDISWDYAFQFGELESDAFEDKRWKCIEAAYKKLKKQFS